MIDCDGDGGRGDGVVVMILCNSGSGSCHGRGVCVVDGVDGVGELRREGMATRASLFAAKHAQRLVRWFTFPLLSPVPSFSVVCTLRARFLRWVVARDTNTTTNQ